MSIYYIIMSMIDGFEAFINLAVMVLTIIASWIMYAKAGEPGWAAIISVSHINNVFVEGNNTDKNHIEEYKSEGKSCSLAKRM